MKIIKMQLGGPSYWKRRYKKVREDMYPEFWDGENPLNGINYEDYNSALSLQKALNREYKLRIPEDNKWGDISDRALDYVIHKNWIMKDKNFTNTTVDDDAVKSSEFINPIKQPTMGEVKLIPQSISNSDTLQLDQNNNSLQATYSPIHKYSRADVRNILRMGGINPYHLTASQRMSIRDQLNSGKYSITYDSGGKLVSKNIIERFKSGGNIQKLQGGRTIQTQSPVVENFTNQYLKKSQEQVDRTNKQIDQRRKAIQRANRKNKAPLATSNLAQLQESLWKIGAFKGLKDKRGRNVVYETAVDGVMGPLTNAAIANAKKLGYNVDRNSGTVSNSNNQSSATQTTQTSSSLEPWLEKAIRGSVVPLPQSQSQPRRSVFDMIAPPGYVPSYQNETLSRYGQTLANSNPAIALVNRKMHGLLGLNANYTHIPQRQIDILSDQNQWIYDNWDTAFKHNLNIAQQTLNKNIELLKNATTEEEKIKLQQQIENNKKSIESIQNNYEQVKKAGSLENWLKNNSGQKMVMGANFALYKNANANRMKGLPTKYANFGSTDNSGNPNTIAYSMDTPLGQVEYIYGNNVQSYMYDPDQNKIITRFSDNYDFNKYGNEESKGIARLRMRAGTDEDLSQRGSISYNSELKPITFDGNKNYVEDFGKLTRSDSPFEVWLLNRVLKHY